MPVVTSNPTIRAAAVAPPPTTEAIGLPADTSNIAPLPATHATAAKLIPGVATHPHPQAVLVDARTLSFPTFHPHRDWGRPWLEAFEHTMLAYGVPMWQWPLVFRSHVDSSMWPWFDALMLLGPDDDKAVAAATAPTPHGIPLPASPAPAQQARGGSGGSPSARTPSPTRQPSPGKLKGAAAVSPPSTSTATTAASAPPPMAASDLWTLLYRPKFLAEIARPAAADHAAALARLSRLRLGNGGHGRMIQHVGHFRALLVALKPRPDEPTLVKYFLETLDAQTHAAVEGPVGEGGAGTGGEPRGLPKTLNEAIYRALDYDYKMYLEHPPKRRASYTGRGGGNAGAGPSRAQSPHDNKQHTDTEHGGPGGAEDTEHQQQAAGGGEAGTRGAGRGRRGRGRRGRGARRGGTDEGHTGGEGGGGTEAAAHPPASAPASSGGRAGSPSAGQQQQQAQAQVQQQRE
ncbi:hypothetical protein H9P43_001405 [Blastocladiella emersonii ATCC 22665]|nr:hypothetical protein H9P43_001405 [Blastocladiella emersonii ATCC 22665]